MTFSPHTHYGWEPDDAAATLQGRPNRQRGDMTLISPAVTSKWAKQSGGPAGDEAQNLIAMNLRGREEGIRPELDDKVSLRSASGGSTRSYIIEDCPYCALDEPCSLHQETVEIASTGVRRLMPIECERLQALPDGWTDFGADSKRYAALGDAVTASVGEWIGSRLIASEKKDLA